MSETEGVSQEVASSRSAFSVFHYGASSELLQGYVEHKRRTTRYFSVSGWSKRLGLPTSGIIVNLMKKRRLPPEDLTRKFAVDMGLNELETDYFLTLVASERAMHANSVMLPILQQRLDAFRVQSGVVLLEPSKLEAMSSVKHVAVKEMLSLRDAKSDPKWIAEKSALPISPEEATRILDVLVASGVLEKQADGSCRVATPNIESTNEQSSEAIRRFHRESLENAADVLHDVPVSKRHFTSYVMPVTSSRLAEAKKAIDHFVYEFAAQFEAKPGDGDQVFQLNVNYVPLTEKENP